MDLQNVYKNMFFMKGTWLVKVAPEVILNVWKECLTRSWPNTPKELQLCERSAVSGKRKQLSV